VVDTARHQVPLTLTLNAPEPTGVDRVVVPLREGQLFANGWRTAGAPFALAPWPRQGSDDVIIQHDFDDGPAFLRPQRGVVFPAPSSSVHQFDLPEICRGALRELRQHWDGQIGYDHEYNELELKVSLELVDQGRFNYVRIGYDSRLIELLDGGRVGSGR